MILVSKELLCNVINNVKLEDAHDNPLALYRTVLKLIDEMPSIVASETEKTELLGKISAI